MKMRKAEFGKIAAAIKTYYPRENVFPNQESIEMWYAQLKDIPYGIMQVAVQKWVATNKWCPTIADLRELCTEIVSGATPDWGSGWKEVIDAIHMYGWDRETEALNSMTPTTRRVVEQMGWLNICRSTNEASDRASFRMMFENLIERKKNEAQLPATLNTLIEKIQDKKLLR